ncbi:MAG: GTP 3',8-cyclase MoaA [Bacteroidetes bacterium]|nr:GTP 3',8-cyclase MoaA [Bacteroidota bacterium]
MLLDNHNRVHDYLRISLTDVCNFRCLYCMPEENISFMPSQLLMQADEIEAIAKVFVAQGVKKIRLTGGEPLVRKDAHDILLRLSKLPVELTLTTNGTRVDEFICLFKEHGIKSINVSIDSLNKETFYKITRRNIFDKIRKNIELLIEEGFHVKVNCVVMRGINEHEILDFIAWTKEKPVHVRFIEFMPFDGNQWNDSKVFSFEEILQQIGSRYIFEKLVDKPHATAKKFKVQNHAGTFAIISTMSQPFCSTCNRMRLTADGKMKNCLFSKSEVDILGAYRQGLDILPLIEQCVKDKEEALGGQMVETYHEIDASKLVNRSMINIGG